MIDVTLFYNERLMLWLRLKHMADIARKHVILESSWSYSGRPKQFELDLDDPLFAPFRDKIIHVKSTANIDVKDPWRREFFQRGILYSAAMAFVETGESAFFCDLDQFVSHEGFTRLHRKVADHGMACPVLRNCVYFLDREEPTPMANAKLCSYDVAINPPIRDNWQELRSFHGRWPQGRIMWGFDREQLVNDAGWHFSSCGGYESVLRKMQDFSHANQENVQEHRRHLLTSDFREWVGSHTTQVKMEDLPAVVQDNADMLRASGLIFN